MRTANAYALAGVDVDIEAEASRIMFEASKATWANRVGLIGEVEMPFDDFSGTKLIPIGGLPQGSYLNLGADGAGTKPRMAQLTQVLDTIGFDLIAMVADDAVQKGMEPAIVVNILDVRSLGTDDRHLPNIQRLANGLVQAANAAGVAVINGEIAQMGMSISGYGDFPFNWAAACAWFVRKDRILTGSKIRVGDRIVLFKERGFRCNGFSLVDRNFRSAYGEGWHRKRYGTTTLGMAVLAPSIIYSKAMVAAHGGFDTEGECEVHGVAHITGGGIPEKLGRLLRPTGLGAELTDLFEMPSIMHECQVAGKTPDYDMYKAFNGGQGMAVVTPKNQVDRLIACVRRQGIEAKDGGVIVKMPGIRIISRGAEHPGAELSF
jgi:phosphoribosylformylglycinamidine cyclo-ligase